MDQQGGQGEMDDEAADATDLLAAEQAAARGQEAEADDDEDGRGDGKDVEHGVVRRGGRLAVRGRKGQASVLAAPIIGSSSRRVKGGLNVSPVFRAISERKAFKTSALTSKAS
ncbi:hypothetical protein D3C81_1565460 [compost metagenome]